MSWATATGGPATRLPLIALAWLAPGLAVGFALSPYLDLTFHRARQATTPGAGRAAFGVGFGGLFLVMLVFSLLYAAPMGLMFRGGALPARLPAWAGWVLLGHIALQAGVTTGLHLHEVVQRRGHAGLHRVGALAVAGGALAYWAIGWFAQARGPVTPEPALFALNPAELVYQCFILFYGLVFPAYVWLVMLPTRKPRPMGGKVALWLVTVVVTLPGAFFGFVGDRPALIGPVLVMLVAARVCLALLPVRESESRGDRPIAR
jgi:hypothetical protein